MMTSAAVVQAVQAVVSLSNKDSLCQKRTDQSRTRVRGAKQTLLATEDDLASVSTSSGLELQSSQ